MATKFEQDDQFEQIDAMFLPWTQSYLVYKKSFVTKRNTEYTNNF